MVGTDTWANSQWAEYRELIKTDRAWRSRFSRPVAEAIACTKAERLFDRKVSNGLVRTRRPPDHRPGMQRFRGNGSKNPMLD